MNKNRLLLKIVLMTFFSFILILNISAEEKKEKPKPYELPEIVVKDKRGAFWYDNKRIKFILRFDHFFFGLQECRVMKTLKDEEDYCKEIVFSSYCNLDRIGIRDTYKKGGMFVFTLEGKFKYYKFEDNFEVSKKKGKYEFDGSIVKDKIKVPSKNYEKFAGKNSFLIDKREMGTWFVMIYYLFQKYKDIEAGKKIKLNLFMIEDGMDFNYETDCREEKKIEYSHKKVTLRFKKQKSIQFRNGYLNVFECEIPKLNISLLIDEFGEMIEFNDNNGFEAKIE